MIMQQVPSFPLGPIHLPAEFPNTHESINGYPWFINKVLSTKLLNSNVGKGPPPDAIGKNWMFVSCQVSVQWFATYMKH